MKHRYTWLVRELARWRMAALHGRQRRGQALLELALSITFISYLFAAAIDLGLAYKSYQTLLNATSEASLYLTKRPVVSCDEMLCPDGSEIGGADREARIRFRNEQGGVIRGTTSTLDLDSNGKEDLAEHGWTWIEDRVKIDEAASWQININDSNFATITSSFNPNDTQIECQRRDPFYQNQQCYIVVRTQLDYKPFALAPVLGNTVTIRAISVQPIVQPH